MRTPKERLEYAVNNILQSIQKLGKVDGKLSETEEIRINVAINYELEKTFSVLKEKNKPFKFSDAYELR